jgi:hypothetical protein
MRISYPIRQFTFEVQTSAHVVRLSQVFARQLNGIALRFNGLRKSKIPQRSAW